jgi:hypothetical protein
MRDELLAAAQSLDEHLARQLGRFDDAFYWQERARATSNGWPARFRGIDCRAFDKNLAQLYEWLLEDYNDWPFKSMRAGRKRRERPSEADRYEQLFNEGT